MKATRMLLLCLMSLGLLFIPLSSAANAAEDNVYLYPCSVMNEGGDSNTGYSADSPVLTFDKAKSLLNDNGTIYLVGGFAAYLLENQSWDLNGKGTAKVSTLSSYTEYDIPSGITLGNMGEEGGIYSLTLSNITIINDGIDPLGYDDSLIHLEYGCSLNLGDNTRLVNETGYAIYCPYKGIVNITGTNVAVTGNIYFCDINSRININAELTNNINVELNSNLIPSGSIIGTVASGISDISKLVCATEGYHFELSDGNILFLAGNAGTCQITATTDGHGVISPASASVAKNGSQTFTITPNEGYSIEDVKVDGDSVLSELADDEGNAKIYTFNNVIAPHTIDATFELLDKIEIILPENVDSLDFGYMKARSDDVVVPAAQTAMVKNTGSNTVKLDAVTLSGAENSDFTVTPSWESGAELAAGESASFTVQPKANIYTAGIYTESVSVTTVGGASAACSAKVQACYILEAACGEHGTFEYFGITTIDGINYINNADSGIVDCGVKITIDAGYVFDTFQISHYWLSDEKWHEYYTDGYIGQSLKGTSCTFYLLPYNGGGSKISATFRLGQFAITALVNGTGGSIAPVGFTPSEEGVVTVDGLTDLEFSITPEPGYHIKDVYVDNTGLAVSDYVYGTYTFPEVDADHSIIAEFEPNSYTIAFNSNGGTGAMDSLTDLEYGTAEKLPANTFTREGYTFAGWTTELTGAVVYNDEEEVDICVESNQASVTLYAVWTGGPVQTKPVYTITPAEDAVYTIDTTDDGIKTMTVNSGHSGLKYFTVNISPVTTHSGDETAVFVHLRNGAQLDLNVSRADFDLVKAASAAFDVVPGDVVKVYMVDELSSALDSNPKILN